VTVQQILTQYKPGDVLSPEDVERALKYFVPNESGRLFHVEMALFREALGTVPAVQLQGLGPFEVVDKIPPKFPKDWVAAYSYSPDNSERPNIMALRDRKLTVHAVVHEIGHHVEHSYLNGAVRQGLKKAFREAKRSRTGFPSEYSKTSASEFFAECYAWSLLDPVELNTRNRMMFHICNSVNEGDRRLINNSLETEGRVLIHETEGLLDGFDPTLPDAGSDTLNKAQPPRPGLMPQSGDWDKPVRWVRPEEAAPSANWVKDNAELLDHADRELPVEAYHAILAFVGHEPGALSTHGPGTIGIMDAVALEEAYTEPLSSPHAREIRRGLESAMAPIREKLRAEVGDSITLYRHQSPRTENAKDRTVLSWTSDREFAEYLHGPGERDVYYLQSRGPYSQVIETDPAYGSVPFSSQESAQAWADAHPGVDIHGDSVGSVDVVSEKRGEKQKGVVVTADVPLDDIVWITDRAGQSEFIVRNTGAHRIEKAQPPRPGLVPQSGDWDHPRRWIRPEQLTHPQIPEQPAYRKANLSLVVPSEAAKIDREFHNKNWRALISEAFGVGVPGYEVHVSSAYVSSKYGKRGAALVVKMRVFYEGGEDDIGSIHRVIFPDQVYHDSFFLDSKHQNKGLAADMLERMEDTYIKHGIKFITLMANDSVGGYAWARQGFDFQDSQDRAGVDREAEESIVNYVANNNLSSAQKERLLDQYHSLEHAWDIAAWNPTNAPAGEHLGKSILLGATYHASKDLDPDSAGYKIGKRYRAARKALQGANEQ
jgi:GNAT superfamily N-acetyltransferase